MGRVIVMGEKRNAWRILVRKVEEIDCREKNWWKWENNFKRDIKEREHGAVNWIKLPLNRDEYGLLWGR